MRPDTRYVVTALFMQAFASPLITGSCESRCIVTKREPRIAFLVAISLAIGSAGSSSDAVNSTPGDLSVPNRTWSVPPRTGQKAHGLIFAFTAPNVGYRAE